MIRTIYTGLSSPCKTPPKKITPGERIYVEPIGAHPARVRAVLEKACYLKVMKYVDQEKHGYIITNAGVQLGDFWALMKALSGEAGSNPDRYCLSLSRKKSRSSGWSAKPNGQSSGQLCKICLVN